MEKEFNLSEKIEELRELFSRTLKEHEVEMVLFNFILTNKEFIKRLKEEIYNMGDNENLVHVCRIIMSLDKLAGEKLK